MRPASAATAAATDAQRAAFKQAYTTAQQQGGDAWRAQAQGLRDYVLYPYLEAAALRHDLSTLDLARVQGYLAAHPGLYEHSHGAVRLKIRGGNLDIASLAAPGFASGASPDWDRLTPMA